MKPYSLQCAIIFWSLLSFAITGAKIGKRKRAKKRLALLHLQLKYIRKSPVMGHNN
jgi:hypothetical protein